MLQRITWRESNTTIEKTVIEGGMSLNSIVRKFWEKGTCGTQESVVGAEEKHSKLWFKKVEENRYRLEPFIHEFVQFQKYQGKKILEVGVGAGTDHLQWARAGASCYGVDLTEAAILTTRQHLEHYGLTSNLQREDAEKLPFSDSTFDLVYSWGVIHHTNNPKAIIDEIYRVLDLGGEFIGMMYHRYSLVTFKEWIKNALLKGKPWMSFKDVLWYHTESEGTKAYTARELKVLFLRFDQVTIEEKLTSYDVAKFPHWVEKVCPNRLGWFLLIKARK